MFFPKFEFYINVFLDKSNVSIVSVAVYYKKDNEKNTKYENSNFCETSEIYG